MRRAAASVAAHTNMMTYVCPSTCTQQDEEAATELFADGTIVRSPPGKEVYDTYRGQAWVSTKLFGEPKPEYKAGKGHSKPPLHVLLFHLHNKEYFILPATGTHKSHKELSKAISGPSLARWRKDGKVSRRLHACTPALTY